MLSKTFFYRVKQANDVTFLTGTELLKTTQYPNNSIFDFRDSSQIDRETFLRTPDAVLRLNNWVKAELPSLKPSLAHYSFLDMESKLTNLHLMTTTSDGLHQSAGSKKVIELNGSYKSKRNVGDITIPNIRFKGENAKKETLVQAIEVSEICEVFVLCGVTTMDSNISSLPFLAKGNGSYMVEISEEETEMTCHCNESLRGDVSSNLVKISMIFNRVL